MRFLDALEGYARAMKAERDRPAPERSECGAQRLVPPKA